jgi:hypothetical protein
MDQLIKPTFLGADTYKPLPAKPKTYVTDLAIKSARAYPGQPIPLADGQLVDKSYLGKIRKQAEKIDPQFEIHFRHRTSGRNKTPKGWSYWYKGEVALSLGALNEGTFAADGEVEDAPAPTPDELAEQKAAKEAKAAKKRAKQAKQAAAAQEAA